jgi:hypothetical protein
MICPLRDKQCLEGECAIWAGDRCAILMLAAHIPTSPSKAQVTTANSREILEGCAAELGRPSIASLRRREIDDFLASTHIVLNAARRRRLFRMRRDIGRFVREERIRDPHETWTGESNRGNAWSDSEDAELTEWYKAGLSTKTIAANHKRTEGAIRARLKKHGLLSDEDGTWQQ